MVEPVDAVIRRAAALGAVVAILLTAFVGAAPAAKRKGQVHEPPYKQGPSGGDEFNYHSVDPQAGEVWVGRLFPGVPPVVGCAPEPAAGYAMLRIPHKVDRAFDKVTVAYDAQLEPYAWMTAGVRAADGEWLGVSKLQGPHFGEGKLKVNLHHRPQPGSTVKIEFGIQLGDACPQFGFGHASFPSVTVGG